MFPLKCRTSRLATFEIRPLYSHHFSITYVRKMQQSVCPPLDEKPISTIAATPNESGSTTQPKDSSTMMDRHEEPNIAGDRLNILLLTYLYGLECVPRCTSEAIALVLRKRNVSYADQAEFSLAPYSYCFKLLWAPIVDCVYSKKMGRRKTWTISSQYLIGISLLYISMNLDEWLGSEDGTTRKPQTRLLTLVYFLSIFFASVQSIAVSGWSLTMLKKRNVGHASMCDNIGYKISQFISFVLFIVLESKEFCNTFRTVPQDRGLVSFSGSLFFWAVVFIVSATLILLFKKESKHKVAEDDHKYRLGLKESYVRLWQIIQIRPVQLMCLIFLTYQVGPGPVNGVARLKLLDAGVPSDTLALLTAPSLPFLVVIPLVLSRFLTGHEAMRTFIITYISKLLFGIVYAAFIYFTPFVKDEQGGLPGWHYWLLLFIYNVQALIEHLMFITVYAFFSRISDPRFGGIYVTLFSAAASIGFRWPQSVCLGLVDLLTIQSCEENAVKGLRECVVVVDGFYVEVIVGVFIGILWLYWAKKKIYRLEDMDRSEWIVRSKSSTNEENKKMNDQSY